MLLRRIGEWDGVGSLSGEVGGRKPPEVRSTAVLTNRKRENGPERTGSSSGDPEERTVSQNG